MYTSLFHLFASFFLVLHRKLYSALLTFSFSLSLSLSCKSADGSKSLPIIIEACGFCRYRGKKKTGEKLAHSKTQLKLPCAKMKSMFHLQRGEKKNRQKGSQAKKKKVNLQFILTNVLTYGNRSSALAVRCFTPSNANSKHLKKKKGVAARCAPSLHAIGHSSLPHRRQRLLSKHCQGCFSRYRRIALYSIWSIRRLA